MTKRSYKSYYKTSAFLIAPMLFAFACGLTDNNSEDDDDTTDTDDTSPTPTDTPDETSIMDINKDPSKYIGEITVTGIVTTIWFHDSSSGDDGYNFWIQDPAGGEYSGMFIFSEVLYKGEENKPVAIGDKVTITSDFSIYKDLPEIYMSDKVGTLTKISSNNALPPPIEITDLSTFVGTDACNSSVTSMAKYLGVRVKLPVATITTIGAQCDSDGGGDFGQWRVAGSNGEVLIDDLAVPKDTYTPVAGNKVQVTGTVYYSYSKYSVVPMSLADIVSVD